MAYKKYIKRNGKLYGPYLYESKRVNGKVISQYKGSEKTKPNKKKILLISLSSFFIIALFLWGTLFSFRLTGQVTSELDQSFVKEGLSGKFNLMVNPGELIPANATVNITTSQKEYEFELEEIVQKDPTISNYYIKGENLNNSGEGYGFLGTKEIIEPVFFKLEIYSIENKSTTEQEKTEEPSAPEENVTTNETIETEENQTIEIEENKTQIEEESNESEPIIKEETEQNLTKSTNDEEQITEKTPTETTSTEEETPTATTNSQEETSETTESQTTSEEKTTEEEKTDITPTEAPTSSEEPIKEETSETTEKDSKSKDKEEKKEPKEKTKTDSPSITGNIVSSFLSGIGNFFLTMTGNVVQEEQIQADVSKGETYTYSLPTNKKARIVPGSVQTQTTSLNDSEIELIQKENKIEVKTNYSIIERGYGEEYYTQEEKSLILDFTKTTLNITKEEEIQIEMIYGEKTIFKESIKIIENQTEKEQVNETIPELAQEIFNQTNQTTNETNLIPKKFQTNLTQAEKNILQNYFDTITVVTKAKSYKDKIIIEFNLNNYTKSNAYESSLDEESLNKLISRDKTLWLKDIAKKITNTKTPTEELPNLGSIEIIN